MDKKLKNAGMPVPDSPTHVEALETSSIRMEMDSIPGMDLSEGPSTTATSIPLHSVRLNSPRVSVTGTSVNRRPNAGVIPVSGGIGPFLWILLSRLSNLHMNCLFTNLLLTDLFAALAAYPCPLLFEFLLNSVNLTGRNNTNSMYKVSTS
ncbi:unnamed protein product [Echinostoma caproni]|uniref:DUF5917 domain-containing protein n=1 Tax=Echinostoma caproni TaxID=27848 RepID=A0A183AIV8_9TREM|nr:unnamed protein product [Echinostoma caproni]